MFICFILAHFLSYAVFDSSNFGVKIIYIQHKTEKDNAINNFIITFFPLHHKKEKMCDEKANTLEILLYFPKNFFLFFLKGLT